MLWFLKKIPPDKIFPKSYMDFEQKYQKDPGMDRVNEFHLQHVFDWTGHDKVFSKSLH